MYQSFAALPHLYDNDAQLRAGKTFLSVLTVGALTAGFSLSALVAFACDSRLFRSEAVYIPGLSSCSLGIVIVLVSFAVSSRYTWGIGAILGTAIGVASTVIYAGLLIQVQYAIRKVRTRGRDFDRQPLTRTRSAVDDRAESAWSEISRSRSAERPLQYDYNDSSRSPASREPAAYTSNDPTRLGDPLSPLPPGLWNADHRPPALSGQRSPLPAGTLYADYNHSPNAQLDPAENVPPEEEETRQQMMKLLLQQTSEQWRQNPDQSTFKIELPEHMRQALHRDGVDRGSEVFSATSLTPPKSKFARSRQQDSSSRGSVYDWRDGRERAGRGKDLVPMTTIPMSDRSKSREDRRREIELGRSPNG